MKRFDDVVVRLPEGKLLHISDEGVASVRVFDANGNAFRCIVPVEYVEPLESHPVM